MFAMYGKRTPLSVIYETALDYKISKGRRYAYKWLQVMNMWDVITEKEADTIADQLGLR